jgi:hypothetical protein
MAAACTGDLVREQPHQLIANTVIVGLGYAGFAVEREAEQPLLMNRCKEQLMCAGFDIFGCRQVSVLQ